jgi:hypothetical protein
MQRRERRNPVRPAQRQLGTTSSAGLDASSARGTVTILRGNPAMAASSARAPKKTSPRQGPAKPAKGHAGASADKAKATAADADVQAEMSREDLQRALASATARIVELEARLAGVTDRVAWIADRLHGLLNNED